MTDRIIVFLGLPVFIVPGIILAVPVCHAALGCAYRFLQVRKGELAATTARAGATPSPV